MSLHIRYMCTLCIVNTRNSIFNFEITIQYDKQRIMKLKYLQMLEEYDRVAIY